MRFRRLSAIACSLLALSLGAVACGGDDEEESTDTAPTISVPSGNEQSVPDATTTTAPEPPPTTGGNGNYDPAKPDSPTNDIPPEPGSPQEKFEQFCEQNPNACG